MREFRYVVLVLLATFPLFTAAGANAPQAATPETGAAAAPDPEIYDGATLYLGNCANCHGIYGEGDGAVTPDLSVVLMDLRYLSARNDGVYPEGFVREIIDGRTSRAIHGPAGMPIWGAEFARSEGYGEEAMIRVNAKVDALVDFLRRIQISD